MAPEIPTLNLQVPLAVPAPARIEELILQAAREAARERLMWLSLEEAAEYLGINKKTLERKRKDIGLPAAVLGGIVRICREDLDALLRAHLVQNGQVQMIAWPSGHALPQGSLGVIAWPSLARRAQEARQGEPQISQMGADSKQRRAA